MKRKDHMVHPDRLLRVLIIEDPVTSPAPLLRELERGDLAVEAEVVPDLDTLRARLRAGTWSMVMSDTAHGAVPPLVALAVLRAEAAETPLVLVTDGVGEEVVVDMVKAGVEDVVLRSNLERLSNVVRRIRREHDTREKEARAHRLAHEALAAKEQMLAIVSHDIKNPLSAIQLEAQMLLRASDRAGKSVLAEEVKIQANRILKTTDRMKVLISDLLDKNKSENGLSRVHRQTVSIQKLVQDVVDSLRPLIQEKELILRTAIPAGAHLSVDRNKMFQVLCNLINNAVKFTPLGGTISVSLEEQDHEVTLAVDDSGPGLSEADLHKAFEKYWTGGDGTVSGTGLGLFICKTIVEAHGGHIGAENLPGTGARFSFTLPKGPAAALRPDARRKDQRKRLFIVDDDDDLREVICWALGKEGFAIRAFSSPVEALEALRRERPAPNLIVVDYHMDEMKGSEFVVRKNDIAPVKRCPVVMISASPHEVEREVPPELYEHVITKPIDLEGLVANVRRYLQ
jgi:signal transduction histidine kinase/CheY-like chemotaxis protein